MTGSFCLRQSRQSAKKTKKKIKINSSMNRISVNLLLFWLNVQLELLEALHIKSLYLYFALFKHQVKCHLLNCSKSTSEHHLGSLFFKSIFCYCYTIHL